MLTAFDLPVPDWCPCGYGVSHPSPFLAPVGGLLGVWAPAATPLPWAIAIPVAFAAIAYLVRGVTRSGATAGAAVAFVLLYFGGPGVFAALMALFVITSVSTRIGYHRKQRLGIAESRHGRNAGQVLANLSVAAICLLVPHICPLLADVGWMPRPDPVLRWAGLLACIAALAEAASDTVSSECGEAWSETAFLVTSFRPVPPGTNGAVSVPGTLAGATAAALVATVPLVTGVLSPAAAAIAGLAGFLGSLVDSLIGATLERRGWFGNNAVNFASTAAAALLAAWSASLFR